MKELKGLEPIKFKEANKNLGRPSNMTEEECKSLWVYNDGYGCISCWKMTFRQRLSALFFGKIWLSVLSGKTQPPVWIGCAKNLFVKAEGEK